MDSDSFGFESWVHNDVVNHLFSVTVLNIGGDPGTVLVPKPFIRTLVIILESQRFWELTKMAVSSFHPGEFANLPIFASWEYHLPPFMVVWSTCMETSSGSKLWMRPTTAMGGALAMGTLQIQKGTLVDSSNSINLLEFVLVLRDDLVDLGLSRLMVNLLLGLGLRLDIFDDKSCLIKVVSG